MKDGYKEVKNKVIINEGFIGYLYVNMKRM